MILILSILLIILFASLYNFRNNVFISFFTLVTFFYVIPVPLSRILNIPGRTALGNINQIQNLELITFLFIVFYLVVVLLIYIIQLTNVNLDPGKNKSNLTLLLILGIILIAQYFNFIISNYGNIIEYFMITRFDRYANEANQGRYVLLLQTLPLIFAYIFIGDSSTVRRYISLAIFIILISSAILLGERRIALGALVTVLVYFVYIGRVSIRNMYLSISILAFSTVLIGVFRNYSINIFQGEDIFINEKLNQHQYQLLINGETANHFIIIDKVISKNRPLLLGESYLNTIPFMLPRFIISDRPNSFGTNFSRIYLSTDIDRSIYASSIIGEAIANFGMLLSIPIVFIFLFLLFLLFKYLLQFLPREVRAYSLAYFFTIILILYRSDNSMILKQFFYNYVSIVLLISFFFKLGKQKNTLKK